MNEKRCLKVVTYFYLPKKEHLTDLKKVKYWLRHSNPGRIIIYNEYNQKMPGKSKAFQSIIGQNLFIEKEYMRRTLKIFKNVKGGKLKWLNTLWLTWLVVWYL